MSDIEKMDDTTTQALEPCSDDAGTLVGAALTARAAVVNRLGFADGHTAGRLKAEREMQEAWSAVVRSTKRVLAMPTQKELRRLRRDRPRPCDSDGIGPAGESADTSTANGGR